MGGSSGSGTSSSGATASSYRTAMRANRAL
jgi:hypothetical protein